MTMKTLKLAVCAAALTAGLGLAASSQANAQAAVMKECGDEFSSARIGGTLAGKTWPQYLSECKLRKEAATAPVKPAPPVAAAPVKPLPPVAAAPVKPLPPVAAAPVKPVPPVAAAPAPLPPLTGATAPAVNDGKTRTPGQLAFYEREKKCGAYWKENKPALRLQTPGIKWPQFLSKCNTELKAAGQ